MNEHQERRAAEQAQAMARANGELSTPQTREALLLLARIRRASYDAHVAAGFNPGQALYLCTQR